MPQGSGRPIGDVLRDVLDLLLYFERKQVVEVGDVRLHPSEIHMLLCAVNGRTFTEVARHFGVTKAAVSQVFARLAAKGIVEVDKDRSYKNAARVSLTPLGKVAYGRVNALRHHVAEVLDRHLGDYSATELATVVRFLEDLRGFAGEALSVFSGPGGPS